MAGNIFGQVFRVITFGESHGPALGGVVEGCPAGLAVDEGFIASEMQRRRPGDGASATARKEADRVEFLSGIRSGITLGSPIAFIIHNMDKRPGDYKGLQEVYRPSHADYTTEVKYGIFTGEGGGRSSGRETASRVVAGAIAKLLLKTAGMEVAAFTSQIGPFKLSQPSEEVDIQAAVGTPLGCPDPELTLGMMNYLGELRVAGDTTGGVVQCVIRGVPPGLGEPVFDKLHADLGKAILSIGACRGFEIGSGFQAAAMTGSQHNDPFAGADGKIITETNWSGGVQGGISNGMDIWFRAAFKPVPSISMEQRTVDKHGQPAGITVTGRHDVCVLPRVIPVVEAMAALVLADHFLRHRNSRI